MNNAPNTTHQLSSEHIVQLLEQKGIKPTANRILVYQTLACNNVPLSLSRIEDLMPLMDKSSIFRTLSLFLQHDVVHSFEDGRGILNYELCHLCGTCDHHDNHIHFYCEMCKQSYCLSNSPIPDLKLPDGFTANNVSFVIKGICDKCQNKNRK